MEFNKPYFFPSPDSHVAYKRKKDFGIFKATLKAGPAEGKPCSCAECADITQCLDEVENSWDNDKYDHWFHNGYTFVAEAAGKCCLDR